MPIQIPAEATALFFTIIFIYYGLAIYTSAKKLQTIESLLENSTFIVDGKHMLIASSWHGRIFRLNRASLALLAPNYFIRKGLLSSRDYTNFPTKLRKFICRLLIFSLILFSIMLISAGMLWGGWLSFKIYS